MQHSIHEVIFDNIPTELKNHSRWIAWHGEPKPTPENPNKLNKIPISPGIGYNAKSNDPNTWGSYRDATERLAMGVATDGRKIDGVSFMLGDGWAGIDIDNCRNPETGEIADWALKQIKRFNTYMEISPSGRGIKIFGTVRQSRNRGKRRGNIEVYDRRWQFTVTGNHLEGTPTTVNDITEPLNALWQELFGSDQSQREVHRHSEPVTDDHDRTLIEKAQACEKNGAKFTQLWGGHWEAAYASQSEADLALCSHLAFWTGGDARRVDSLFRQSGLCRDKWDERHGKQTYGQMTVNKALSNATFYDPACLGNPPKSQSKADTPPPNGDEPNGTGPPATEASEARASDNPKPSLEAKTPEAQSDDIRREILEAGMMDEGFERTEKTKAIINRLVGLAPVDGAAFIERMRKADLGTKAVLEEQLKAASKAQEKASEAPVYIPKIPVGSPIPLTDDWNAVRFVKEHGTDVRYSYEWGKWLVYDGRQWKVDVVGEVIARAKQTVRKLYALAAESQDDAERKILADHAKRSDSNVKIKAFLALAESEVPILVSQLDANPMLLNVENGTIDLTTGKIREHRREDYLTKLAPVDYKPDAPCDFWHSFLDKIMGGNSELIDFLQRAIGYSLTDDLSEQVLFFLYGIGSNGKSTFLEAIISLLGDYAKNAEPDILMLRRHEVHPTGVADLMGARFVSTVETGEGRRMDEVKVKQLTGGDTLKARFMRQDFFSFKPTHKLFLAANHKPIIRGTDYAIWRRIRLIPFEVTIPETERIPLREVLTTFKKEGAGILAWAVRGCLDWQQNGLGTPTAVKQATEAYRGEMDVIGDFLDEHCLLGEDYVAKASSLYAGYKAWCEAAGEMPLSQKAFGGRLTERGFQRTKKRSWWYWVGIGITEQDAPDPSDGAHPRETNGHMALGTEVNNPAPDRAPSGLVKQLENGASRSYMAQRGTMGRAPSQKDSEPSHGVHSSDMSFSDDRAHAAFLHAWHSTCGNQMVYAEKLIPLAQAAGFDLTANGSPPRINIERILKELTNQTVDGLTVRCLGDGAYHLEGEGEKPVVKKPAKLHCQKCGAYTPHKLTTDPNFEGWQIGVCERCGMKAYMRPDRGVQ